jgi:peptide/nickel transport system permease protein
MLAYVVRRLVATVFVMTFVAFFVFSLLYLTPGDPAATIAGDLATADDIARIHRQLGLDDPFLVRFGHWAWGVLQGDLRRCRRPYTRGLSATSAPRAPATTN